MLPNERKDSHFYTDNKLKAKQFNPLMYISVRDIANVKSGDIGGKSDIYYKVLMMFRGEWQEIKKSEITKNTLSVHYHDASAPIIPDVTHQVGKAVNVQEWKRPGAVWQV